MVNKVCYFMVGIPCSGKSTVAKHVHGGGLPVFSLDTLRLEFSKGFVQPDVDGYYQPAYRFCKDHDEDFQVFTENRWKDTLNREDVFVLDNTHISKNDRKNWIVDLRLNGFMIVGIEVNVPLSVALERNKSRVDERGRKHIPESVINEMYFKQQGVMLGSEVDELYVIDGTTHQPVWCESLRVQF